MKPTSSTKFITHSINFCAVDLSSLYIDITKDRMYCDAPDSSRRRATQAAMHKVFDALCRLLAPILAFTAEEAWRYSKRADRFISGVPGTATSHADGERSNCGAFEIARRNRPGDRDARQEKLIGNALEAAVVLHSDSNVTEKSISKNWKNFLF